MVRPRSKSRHDLVANAMLVFWRRGFAATSMDDLVNATGVSRGGIYADFGGKDDLFLSCLGAYRLEYIEPALQQLRSGGDALASVEAYFDFFIELHRRHGMPGPGCFFANVMTERAPHEAEVLAVVKQHMVDLRHAFRDALGKGGVQGNDTFDNREPGEQALDQLAGFLATASQGLWSYARSSTDSGELESFKQVLLDLLKTRLSPIGLLPQ